MLKVPVAEGRLRDFVATVLTARYKSNWWGVQSTIAVLRCLWSKKLLRLDFRITNASTQQGFLPRFGHMRGPQKSLANTFLLDSLLDIRQTCNRCLADIRHVEVRHVFDIRQGVRISDLLRCLENGQGKLRIAAKRPIQTFALALVQ